MGAADRKGRSIAKWTACAMLCVLAATAAARGVADLVEIANTIRLHGCHALSPAISPLRAQAKLADVARGIAHGDSLQTAVDQSGYRAEAMTSIHIQATADDGFEQVLAERFCSVVADTSLREIGVFREADDTWLVLATPLVSLSPDDLGPVAEDVLELINQTRSQTRRCGWRRFPASPPLHPVAALERAARAHAQDLADHNHLGHEGSDGSLPADRVSRAGYSWVAVAENVAAGQATAEDVVGAWLASPGHCANLMGSRYSHTGVAYAVNPTGRGTYWVQVFAASE